MSTGEFVRGDLLGIDIPADARALREGGVAFLTRAFRATGALSQGNRVSRIVQLDDFLVGGTGSKALLTVEYEQPTDLPTALFVKFSRDFTDAIRDRNKHMMEPEVRFALLSRASGFPIVVPQCLFADYEQESGTGILITSRVPFGEGTNEPCYEKCVDYEIPNTLEHYKALITADARLAAAHKSGKLASDLASQFPYDPQALLASDRIVYSPQALEKKIAQLKSFAQQFPQLLPANTASERFLSRFAEEAQRYLAHEHELKSFLYNATDFVALCHWNANIDNGWFWRNERGELECGLLDWGRVGQLNVAQAIFGALCAAETSLWDEHLDELLGLFVNEFHKAGGGTLDVNELKFHVQLFTALMGIAWIIGAPGVVQSQVPNLAEVKDRFDPKFKSVALARVQLQLLTVFLNAWETQDFGQVLDRFIERTQAPAAATL